MRELAQKLSRVERALLTKELAKAQAALWTAFSIAAKAKVMDVAKNLREQHKELGTTIVELNGGPVISRTELFRT